MSNMPARLRIAVIAPSLDGNDIGEVYGSFKWIEAMAQRADVTVLSSSRRGAQPLADQLPAARVVTWPEIPFLYEKMERFNAQAKPGFPLFRRQVRAWMHAALAQGEVFDITHQILPQAMRHSTPLRGLGIPYVLGPLGGGLETPRAFQGEVADNSSIASRMRALDVWRRRWDPQLRASFAEADLMLGVAPYIADILAPLNIRRFHVMHEIGRGPIPPEHPRQNELGQLKLLHVGRTIRTKGLRDTVRAMGHLRDMPGVSLTVAGDGADMPACRAEAERLDLMDRITFLGKQPRDRVEELYAQADAFCFPSFREPLGGVLLEALAHGLPIITAARGGPDAVVDDSCGFRIPVTEPDRFARDIADAIRKLADDPQLRLLLGQGARRRYAGFDDWDAMADRTIGYYQEVLENR